MGLTVLRLLLAPVLVWLVYAGASGVVFAIVVLVAFVSDYFDGMLARKLGVASAELRHFDSRADLVFYATAAWAVWRLHPDVVRSVAIPALVVIGLDIVRHVFDFAKFGRDVAYHAWSSKVWGLSLALAMVLLMGFGVGQPFVGITVILGLIAQIEGLLISVALPVWTHDVPTLIHALRIRNAPVRRAVRDGK
ncbi:MAG TPA: CDP-alcohol phosphatidyltransferase family protein [Gemmatimonadaceae bacterium]|jgi:phosphatidylglycerophosphate synthase|nr:CDP-alcohol phosphatidyltransferase family protein [Gemmatimonadaceae bacterium]